MTLMNWNVFSSLDNKAIKPLKKKKYASCNITEMGPKMANSKSLIRIQIQKIHNQRNTNHKVPNHINVGI